MNRKYLNSASDTASNPHSALMCAITNQALEDFTKWTPTMGEFDKKTALLWILKIADQYGYQKKTVYESLKKKYNLSEEQIAFYDDIMEREVYKNGN